MAKRQKPKGRSMRNGKAPSPYEKYGKKPFQYNDGRPRLINGELRRKANDRKQNKYSLGE